MSRRPMSEGPSRSGVLRVDKPSGPTSHDVVSLARRSLGCPRIGHTGTLDPLTSGLLLLCVGWSTRIAEFLTGLNKTYLATARLGEVTETDDGEGPVLRRSDAWQRLTEGEISAAVSSFRGSLRQVPPRYCAKKHGGEPLHRRVRRGEQVAPEPVDVQIHAMELLDIALPLVRFRVECSSGTYVRAVARDLGELLGAGAHLAELRRTRIGPFRVEDAVPAAEMDRPAQISRAWLSPAEALASLPSVQVDEERARRLEHGQAVPAGPVEDSGSPVSVLCGGSLLAVGTVRGGLLEPRKVFPRD